MNLQRSLWGKIPMLSLMIALVSLTFISCEKDPVVAGDEPLQKSPQEATVSLVANGNDNAINLVVAGELPNGDIIYEFPSGKESGVTIEKSAPCDFRSCVKVAEGSVVYIQGNNPFTGPYVVGPFCGPIKSCFTIPNFPVPQNVTATYVGRTGAYLSADLYPSGGPLTFPPDLEVNFPADLSIPIGLAEIITQPFSLTTGCDIAILSDM